MEGSDHPDWSGVRRGNLRLTAGGWGSPGLGAGEAENPALVATSTGGCLVINADDWGMNRETTDRTFEGVRAGSVTSVSAMVFMEGSERAAQIAREHGIDAGLHLNLTSSFSHAGTPGRLVDRQRRLAKYLRNHRLAAVLCHPGLSGHFEYVVRAQLEEFERIYGFPAGRIDGHHHAHLCANVVRGGLLPAGTIVRRNFSFLRREKGWANRFYRNLVDGTLAKRHRIVDLFFSLPPFQPNVRLQRIFSAALDHVVELETHPANADEYRFLTGQSFSEWTEQVRLKSFGNLC